MSRGDRSKSLLPPRESFAAGPRRDDASATPLANRQKASAGPRSRPTETRAPGCLPQPGATVPLSANGPDLSGHRRLLSRSRAERCRRGGLGVGGQRDDPRASTARASGRVAGVDYEIGVVDDLLIVDLRVVGDDDDRVGPAQFCGAQLDADTLLVLPSAIVISVTKPRNERVVVDDF